MMRKGSLDHNLKLSFPSSDEVALKKFLTESGTFMDGDLLVNRDGVRIVSQSEVETPPLIQPTDNQISLADFDAIKVIGKGNGGIVRLVQHKWTGQFFVLKVIQMNIEESARRQIAQELKINLSSQCPNVVVCYQSFYENGAISIILEYMDGGSLADFLKKVKTIPEPYLAAICKQVLKGLWYLHHERHIIHRDLKPSNLLINHRGEVKITDFGASTILASPSGRANTFVGTYDYMSPERISGGKHGYMSDIWSLGLVLLECAVGHFPYSPPQQGEGWVNVYELMETIVDQPPPCAPADQFSPEFCSFISECLKKDPKDRRSANELMAHPFINMFEDLDIDLSSYFTNAGSPLATFQNMVDLTEARGDKKWNFMEIHLTGSKLSELPENPKCPALKTLWLDNNPELMEIPDLFFKDMPLLQSLDLSYTSIKSLPHSISNLVSLRKFNLRGCELLMELPSQIRALRNLEVFDLEGTEIMYLPQEMGELTSLRFFRVSLSGRANRYRVTKQMGTTIPTKMLSKLYQLVTLSIEVNPDGEWWEADVKAILNELSSLKRLKILELYLPSAELLQQLRWDSAKPMYPDLLRFRITVGRHPQRIISRLQHEVEELVKKWEKSEKCLKYVNGEDTPTEITKALNHATVLFLDRHWTVKLLSKFGNENMVKLKFCLLVECNELQTIIDGDYEYPVGADKQPVFERLHYLGIHYMKNLQSIWKGSIEKGCLSNLRSLALHTCPNLTTIFTSDLLGNLDKLEELVVEDCSKIKCLVSHEPCHSKPGHFLPSLKKVSLLDLPELVSIFGALSVGPVLESLVVYNCPKLESLYAMEVSSIDLKIKGEKEWWDRLKWHESEWSSSTRPAYEEPKRGEDLMVQLAKDVYF